MYTSQDLDDISVRIRRNAVALAAVLAVLLAVYVWALAAGIQWLAMAMGALLFAAACYMLLARLLPLARYRRFLLELSEGLSRTVPCTVVEIAGDPELHDGAMVLPVRVQLPASEEGADPTRELSVAQRRLNRESHEDTGDERILYLNASKRDRMPGPGAKVILNCFGRHIRAVEADGE
ncbi:MAG: hypothetical protein IJH38_02195 [Clostridia bacterium]|nr:hypothetical protein [Clostridia bacterium]